MCNFYGKPYRWIMHIVYRTNNCTFISFTNNDDKSSKIYSKINRRTPDKMFCSDSSVFDTLRSRAGHVSILKCWFSKFMSLESQALYRSGCPINDIAILIVDQIFSDICVLSPFGPRLCFWRFSAVRKCSTASLWNIIINNQQRSFTIQLILH